MTDSIRSEIIKLTTDWTTWYVYIRRKGMIRLLIKPSINTVHGSAGSVSNQIHAKQKYTELSKIDGVNVIRFHRYWARHHGDLLHLSFSLEEYISYQRKKLEKELRENGQNTLFDFWEEM